MSNAVTGVERAERIREILKQKVVVKVDDLCSELGASPATIRRDLAELDEKGYLRRVHGGAVGIEGRLDEPMFDDKAEIAAKEKQAIAEAAVKLIGPTDSIFLDGGSTVLALARLLTGMTRLTVVTNSLRVAGIFASSGPRTIVVGGEFRRLSQTFVGPLTQPISEQLHVDKAFMGTIGLSINEGMTTTDSAEAMTKELMISRAREVILLADSSKIGKVSFCEFSSLEQVNTLVTDKGISGKDRKALTGKGLKIVKA